MDVTTLRNHLGTVLSLDEPERGDLPRGASAVLVPIIQLERPHLLFTRRARNMAQHPGEISFPGGRVDEGDASPRMAALRECEEEVGIAPEEVEVMGHLTEYTTYRGQLISVYVGEVDPVRVPRDPASEEEVDEVLYVPIDGLFEPDPSAPREPRSVHDGGPLVYDVLAYEGRRLEGDTRRRNVVHYWHLAGGASTIWGITGEVVARLLDQALGWRPPAEAREIATVEEFRPTRRRPV